MKPYIVSLLALWCLVGTSCSKDKNNVIIEEEQQPEAVDLYFPPLNSSTWETTSINELEWNTAGEQALLDFLEEKNTKAFILLKDGKIVIEWYAADHGQDVPWYWASAGKTLTSFTTGIALEEGYLSLADKTSDYLGQGWTSTPTAKEDLITIRNQLTMTTGMDDTQGDCKTPDCLTYVADAGTRWAYHNAPFTLIQEVVPSAVNTPFEDYFDTKLKNKIGMTGTWISSNGMNNVYWSTARSMARFGLLNLNNGVWNGETVLAHTDFLNDMKNTSQDLNKSYGYLWWLNGKESSMLPSIQVVFDTPLMPDAPADLYAGLGKDDQKLHIVPSKNIVVVRMGEDGGQAAAGPSGFDNLLWEKINAIIN